MTIYLLVENLNNVLMRTKNVKTVFLALYIVQVQSAQYNEYCSSCNIHFDFTLIRRLDNGFHLSLGRTSSASNFESCFGSKEETKDRKMFWRQYCPARTLFVPVAGPKVGKAENRKCIYGA